MSTFSITSAVYFTLYEEEYQESLHGQSNIHQRSCSNICNTVQNLHNLYASLVKLPSLKDKVKMLLNCKIWPCRFAKLL